MKLQLNVLLLFFAITLYGQENATLISGALRADFGPGGALYAPDGSHFLRLEINGEYLPLMFEAGLLLGGVDPGGNLKLHDLRGSGSTPGIIGNTSPVEKHWRVTAEEIAAHQADYADNGIIDNPIASIYSWPGRGNINFEAYNGFSIDTPYEYIAPFWDNDFDAIYEPQNGDYPIMEIRGCLETPVVVSEMVFFPIMSTANSDSEPKVQIYLIAFRVACEEVDNPINNSIFLRYKIINRNVERREDFHFGFYADGDIGCSADDYVGTFPSRFSSYFYNADKLDSGCIGGIGSFGNNPPVFAIDLFRLGLNIEAAPLSLGSSLPIYETAVGGAAFPAATLDYETPVEAYNYLQGKWRDGSPLLDESLGYNSGNPTSFGFPGDPVEETGWSEIAEHNPSGGRKVIMSSEAFTHYPGAVNEFIIGFTYNDDPTVSHTEKIVGLRNNVDLIQSLFDGCFEVNESTSELLGCSPLTTSLDEITEAKTQLTIYPNPASSLLQIELKGTKNGLLQVYQPNGQIILEKEVSNGSHELDIANWPKGLYLLQWKNKHGIVTEKLVIQ